MVVLSVLYLVSPLDFLADVVFLIVGVIGDAALVTWVAGAVPDESEQFLEWELRREMGGAEFPVAAGARYRGGCGHR